MTERELKRLDVLAMSILVNQIALHYNEEVKKLGSVFYKHELKRGLNIAIPELIKSEQKEFDKLEEADGELSHKTSTDLYDVLGFLCKNGLSDFMYKSKVNIAAHYDRKRLEGIVDKIIKENQHG